MASPRISHFLIAFKTLEDIKQFEEEVHQLRTGILGKFYLHYGYQLERPNGPARLTLCGRKQLKRTEEQPVQAFIEGWLLGKLGYAVVVPIPVVEEARG